MDALLYNINICFSNTLSFFYYVLKAFLYHLFCHSSCTRNVATYFKKLLHNTIWKENQVSRNYTVCRHSQFVKLITHLAKWLAVQGILFDLCSRDFTAFPLRWECLNTGKQLVAKDLPENLDSHLNQHQRALLASPMRYHGIGLVLERSLPLPIFLSASAPFLPSLREQTVLTANLKKHMVQIHSI